MKKILLFACFFCFLASAQATVCGNNGTSSSAPAGGLANNVYSWPSCTLSVPSAVLSCGVYWVLSTGNVSCAVYATSAGAPIGGPICTSASTPAAGALTQQVIPISGCGTLSAGTYAIAFITDNAVNTVEIAQTSSGGIYGSISYTSYNEANYNIFPTNPTWTTSGGYLDGAVFLNVGPPPPPTAAGGKAFIF